jgi:hypothetical protein
MVVGRESAHALYDERFVTFGEDDVYQQSDAAGFIRLFALPARVRALKDQEIARAASVDGAADLVAPKVGESTAVAPLDADSNASEEASSSPELAVA